MNRTYLDYAASTPVDPRAAAAAARAALLVGNPSSLHEEGRMLRVGLDGARASVAALLGAAADEIVFTSGATEANTAAMLGVFFAARRAGKADLRVLLSPFEHSSIVSAAQLLAREFGAVIDIMPSVRGVVLAEATARMVRPETAIVACMWANNVTGAVQPVADIGLAVAAERGRRGVGGMPISFVCDAVQAVPSIVVAPAAIGADLLTISSHKIYGPRGAAALFVRRGASFVPITAGGGQEFGMRGGTEDASAIAGFGVAADILRRERGADAAHAAALRRLLLERIAAIAPDARIVEVEPSVPGIVYCLFPRGTGDEYAMRLDAAEIAVSVGSACDAGTRRPPGSLQGIMREDEASRGGVRISFGRFTTEGDILTATMAIKRI